MPTPERMVPNHTLFILILTILLVGLITICLLFFFRKPIIQSGPSIPGRTHQDSSTVKPKYHLIETPLQDPVEAGFKPMKSDFADSQGVMQLLILLQNSFDKDGVKANIAKVIEFFGPGGEELLNRFGSTEME